MKTFLLIKPAVAIAMFMAGMTAAAIPTTCEVTLEEQSDSEITLISSAAAQKTKEAETMAIKQAFFALLDRGIKGVHSNMPMLTAPNKEFNYTFYKDERYKKYLASTPVLLDETKISSMKKVNVRVSIKAAALLADLTANKMSISPAWQDKTEVSVTSAVNPTIVVVPYVRNGDQSFEAMKELMDTDPAMKYAVNTVSSQFADHGYKTRDFLTMLGNSKTDDIMLENTQTDAKTMVIQQLPGDIVVTVDLDLFASGGKGLCTVGLNAVERQTAGKLAAVSYGSGQYMTTDFITLTGHALKKVENNFFDQIQNAFDSMIEKGREMNLEFVLSETVSDWDFDLDTPVTGVDFKEELEEWLRSEANHGIFDMSQSNDKFIAASINIPIWDTARNRSYTINNFSSALRKFMKRHFGDAYRAKVTSMGQKLIITIE